ncbi:hypothetical protein KX250_19565, partial [Escherichia coli]|nr:hypothetical protein [Escherichia coli]
WSTSKTPSYTKSVSWQHHHEKLNSKSSFDLTKDVCNSSEWGLAELKMRHEKMKTQLKKLWLV